MVSVHWTVKAQRRFRSASAKSFCASGCRRLGMLHVPEVCVPLSQELLAAPTCILERTFPGAEAVVVQDLLSGFRNNKPVHVFLVEVIGGDEPGTYIVKIGPCDQLVKELRNWEECKPVGLRHDLLFLPLREGFRCDEPAGAGEPQPAGLMSVVYGDAQQFIGVDQTALLEHAVLQSVRFGLPTVPSIGFVLVEIFERIGHLMYCTSFVDDPAREGYVFDLKGLAPSMERWQTDAVLQQIRREAFADPRGVSKYIDPVSYFEYVRHFSPAKGDPAALAEQLAADPPPAVSAEVAIDDADEFASPPTPSLTQVIPRLLRGVGHGDLHGRNILVGLVGDRVLWPTVFDYEDMSCGGLIGWDFVKLEVELKIRVYPKIYRALRAESSTQAAATAGSLPQEELAFTAAIKRFELQLNELTEACHRSDGWPLVGDPQLPAERLLTILLELRRMAAAHLGVNRGRPNDWLEEYYFLLACYGIGTARFPNLQHLERLGAYISAGVAAARLSWPRKLEEHQQK